MNVLTLTDQVADTIGKRISGGELAIGSALPSAASFANEFGVSVAVVREALSTLRSQGLIQTRQGASTLVLARSVQSGFQLDRRALDNPVSLGQLFEFRCGVEADAAAYAAQRATASELKELGKTLARLQKHVLDGEGVEADIEFHLRIARAARNRYHLQIVQYMNDEIGESIAIARSNSAQHTGVPERVMREHEAVYRAIEQRDPKAAAAAMRKHLVAAAGRLALPSDATA